MINEIQPKIKFQNIVQCPFNIVIKELQIVFWSSTVSNVKTNMKELERKNSEKLMFQ